MEATGKQIGRSQVVAARVSFPLYYHHWPATPDGTVFLPRIEEHSGTCVEEIVYFLALLLDALLGEYKKNSISG